MTSRSSDLSSARIGPKEGEPTGDYLFRRNGLFGEGGFLQASTLFGSRELLARLPFLEDLDKTEDLDWVLRASLIEGCCFQFAGDEEPLLQILLFSE